MSALTENENWICDNCDEEMSGPECALCGEPKEGRKPNIEKIVQILKGLNMKTIFESHVELQEFVDEVDLVYKDEKPTAFFEPREDLNEESVLDYAATLLKSFDEFFQISIPEYIKLDIESKKLLYELNDTRKKHLAIEQEIPIVLKKHELNLKKASIELSTTDEFKKRNAYEQLVMDAEVQQLIKAEQKKHFEAYEKELIKLHAIMGSLQDKWKASLKEIQKIRKESLKELFEHMKETTGTELTEKELSVIYNTAVEILGISLVNPPVIPGRPHLSKLLKKTDKEKKRTKRLQFLQVESYTWLETLTGFVTDLKEKEIEDTDSWFRTVEEDEEEAQKKGDELLEEQRKEEEKKRRRREKKKKQKTRKRLEKQKKEAEDQALRLRAEELAIQEEEKRREEDAALVEVAKPKDVGMSKEEEVPLSSLDEQLISRITELYEYLQTQDIFRSERIKREARMELAKPYQEKMLKYIITKLIPILKSKGIGLVVTGGFATHLLSNGHYDTEDIDIKVYNINEMRDIPTMRQIVKRVIGPSLKSDEFKIFDPIEIEWGRDAPKAAEMVNNGNIPLKITARINIGEYRNDRNPTDYDAISEITYNDTMLYKDIKKQYVEDIPIQDQVSLIDNLLNHATINFKQRMAEGERNIYPEKILGWFKQLQELLRQTTKSNAVEVMNKTLSRIKSPSPKQGGKRKTRKRRKRRTRRKKNRKKRTRRK